MTNKYPKLKFNSGWMGGNWSVDDKIVDRKKLENAILIIKNKKYPIVLKDIEGKDYDHGHIYHWDGLDVGVIDGVLLPRFLSVKLLKCKVRIILNE